MSKYNGLKVGDKVIANGYEGKVTKLCDWSESLVEIRLSRGEICVCSTTVTKI